MSAIFIINAKGNSLTEINKNLQLIDSFMDSNQNIFNLVSDIKNNPRIYYNKDVIVPKDIHDLITNLKTNKEINYSIKGIQYHGSLNKV